MKQTGPITLALLAMVAVASGSFYDCKRGGYWTLRCCTSNELPKGCECFGRTYFYLKPYPKCPSDIGVQFFLFTKTNNNKYQVKSTDNSLATSTFKSSNPTKFIIHGFTDKGPDVWSTKMKNALLGLRDMNVIIVNWKHGAAAPKYLQAAANTRIVGAMTARLIQVMKNTHGVSLDDIHIIGHSLGAHAAGLAGKEVHRLESALVARVTGLDPAGPSFERDKSYVKLGKTDAKFVDVIHTDITPLIGLGFGYRYSIGQVDFYPNGGKNQPGCSKTLKDLLDLTEISDTVACSHVRVLDIFTDSISSCTGVTPDPNTNCVMGYHAKPSLCTGDDKSVTTTSTSPFCPV